MRSPRSRWLGPPGLRWHFAFVTLLTVLGSSLLVPSWVAAEDDHWQARLDLGPDGAAITPPRPFQARYRLHWNEIDAARAELDFRANGAAAAGEWQTRVEARTVGLARNLWALDATHVAVAGGNDLRPVRLEETESLAKRRDVFRVHFEADGAAVRQHRRSQPPGTPEVVDGSDKRFSLPGLRDINAAFLYARTLPLVAGERHTFAVMSAKNPYRVSVRVVGRGPVQTRAGRFPAIEMEVSLDKVDIATGRLKPHKLFKSARAWLTDDTDRLPLKVETQIFIGHITMEMESLTRTGA